MDILNNFFVLFRLDKNAGREQINGAIDGNLDLLTDLGGENFPTEARKRLLDRAAKEAEWQAVEQNRLFEVKYDEAGGRIIFTSLLSDMSEDIYGRFAVIPSLYDDGGWDLRGNVTGEMIKSRRVCPERAVYPEDDGNTVYISSDFGVKHYYMAAVKNQKIYIFGAERNHALISDAVGRIASDSITCNFRWGKFSRAAYIAAWPGAKAGDELTVLPNSNIINSKTKGKNPSDSISGVIPRGPKRDKDLVLFDKDLNHIYHAVKVFKKEGRK